MYVEEPCTTTNSADFAGVARTPPDSPTNAVEEEGSGAEAAAEVAAPAASASTAAGGGWSMMLMHPIVRIE